MDLGLAGRTVIVTGASGGIGRHIARGFAAEGADIVLTHRNSRSEAELVAKEIGDRALLVGYDMADAAAPARLVKQVLAWTGRIDVLVNNAVDWGGDDVMAGPFEQAPEEHWVPVLRANIEGAVRLSRMAVPTMRQRRFGRLVHISSSVAEDGMPGG